MKIAFVSVEASDNRRAFSGLTWSIRRMLEDRGVELVLADGLHMPAHRPRRWLQVLLRHGFGLNYLPERSLAVREAYARQAESRLKGREFHAILSPGAIPVSRLYTDKPIVIWTDATFAGLTDYYWDFSRLVLGSRAAGMQADTEAFRRCRFAVFSSDWAAETALRSHELHRDKARVIPFGINLECNHGEEEIRRLVAARQQSALRLLFVGVDWRRKGGDRVLELGAYLQATGIPVQIDLVGGRPRGTLPSFARAHGFLSKANAAGAARLRELYSQAHFLVLPTRAECAAVSVAEAAAFGVPSLTTAVGGNPSMLRDGETGFLMPPDAPVEAYAAPLSRLRANPALYERFALGAFADYRRRFTWEGAAARLLPLLEGLA